MRVRGPVAALVEVRAPFLAGERADRARRTSESVTGIEKARCQSTEPSISGSTTGGSDERTATCRPSSSVSFVKAAKPSGVRRWSVTWLARSAPPAFISKLR